jgi:hypothetical protein
VDQADYVKNKLTGLNSEVAPLRKSDENEQLSEGNAKKYSTTVGRLIWILPTHPRYSYEISYLSRYRAFPRVKHFRRMAALVSQIKRPGNEQRIFLPRFHSKPPLKLIAIVDAGAGEEADAPLK